MSLITPRTLKGFRDVLPVRALHQQRMIRTLQDVFRAHGYGPIETPALEYAEILKGKVKSVVKVQVAESKQSTTRILTDSSHSWNDRILAEQFLY